MNPHPSRCCQEAVLTVGGEEGRKSDTLTSQHFSFSLCILTIMFVSECHAIISLYHCITVECSLYFIAHFLSSTYMYTNGVCFVKKIIVSIESEDLASATEGPLAQDLFPYLLWWFQYFRRGCKNKTLGFHLKQTKLTSQTDLFLEVICQWNECAWVTWRKFLFWHCSPLNHSRHGALPLRF